TFGYVRLAHALTSSHAMAPARSSRGSFPPTSTIVDGGPPGVGPASSRRSIFSPSARATSSGLAGAASPLRFALVAVSGRPQARQSWRVTSCAVTRTPTRPLPQDTDRASVSGAAMTSVSGPGQNLDARHDPTDDSDPRCVTI